DAQLTNHGATVCQVEDGKGMPMERGDGNDSEGQAVTNVSRRETNNQHQDEQQARGDRSSLKVLHLPHFIGELSGRDVEASQAADATPDEEHKNERIQAAAHAQAISYYHRSNPEADNIGERIQLLPKRRGLGAVPRDPAIGDIKHQG